MSVTEEHDSILTEIFRKLTGNLGDVEEKLEDFQKEMIDFKELHQTWKLAKKIPKQHSKQS